MLNEMVPMSIVIIIDFILCILIAAIMAYAILIVAVIVYAICKENKIVAAITLFFLFNIALGMYFYVENKVTENYIKENQASIYIDGEPISENFE